MRTDSAGADSTVAASCVLTMTIHSGMGHGAAVDPWQSARGDQHEPITDERLVLVSITLDRP